MESKNRRGKSNRIFGMAPLQVIVLSVLGGFALILFGVLAGLILSNKNSLPNIQPIAPISYPTNAPPLSTTRPNNQASDCDSIEVNTWVDQSGSRINAMDSDLEFLSSYSPSSYDEITPYAKSAEQRYYAQLSQRTPACLQGVQEIALEELRLFWRGLEASSNGDINAADDYLSRFVEISLQVDQAIQEIEQKK